MKQVIRKHWWKALGVVLVAYALVGGLLLPVPALPILNESIRNLFYHVPMWFGMVFMLAVSMTFSVRYLASSRWQDDAVALEAAHVGVLFGALGLLTGMVWARVTWSAWWVNDAKLNGAAIGLLMYLAYFVLRASFEEVTKKARLGAVYNIFAFAALIPLLFILPRMTDSLHPGSGGNPGFNVYDLDNTMRLVFYPAIVGWALLGVWIIQLRVRIHRYHRKKLEAS